MRIPLREFPFNTEDKGGQGQGVKTQLLTRYYFSYSFRYSISCDIANFFTTKKSRESSIIGTYSIYQALLFQSAEKYTCCTMVIYSRICVSNFT